jgi:hypothetical protein
VSGISPDAVRPDSTQVDSDGSSTFSVKTGRGNLTRRPRAAKPQPKQTNQPRMDANERE